MGVKIQHDEELMENHDINVTPFIDVMLVLLIIFMVAAPLSTVDIQVDLPASTAESHQKPDTPLYLTIKADHSLALGNDSISRNALENELLARTEGDRETRIFLRADKSVDYDTLMQTMNQLRDAGYLKVALVALEEAGP